ncbi:Non-specific serine/threonine protein kinase [Sulfidibacter corallicola]|uniref:non-specific serine/threonine protein kinase n=1 Tax=Sulfidibacter corallicola TaxID=2818388 RepID=A0A8A4TXH5_SULCO|nr:bifunctional serine/threonine-protein kinase/formylglycine-generating enzyme family protein [Sulfidibacter corallicola]QTD53672.1 SUMF1/EgtB/PvdO family nonheme iron enzyme [Sulfidibacter corallicola]
MKCPNCDSQCSDEALFCQYCGLGLADEDDLHAEDLPEARLKTLINRTDEFFLSHPEEGIQIIRKLGEGAMGVVYEANDLDLDRRVAVKVLPYGKTSDPVAVERFQREAKVAAALQHPNIVAIHNIGTMDKVHYFTMALLEGGSLESRIAQGLEWREAVRIVSLLAGALDYAHRRNVIHRDIKPGNIMFDAQETPILVDFGIARALDQASLTATQAMLGTPYYLSPEQATGGTLGPATDLYSLGAVFFQMLTGSVLFQADNPMGVIFKHVKDLPQPPSAIKPNLPKKLDEIVLRLLAKSPQERYADGAALGSVLHTSFPELFGSVPHPAQMETSTWNDMEMVSNENTVDRDSFKHAMLMAETEVTGTRPEPASRRGDAASPERTKNPWGLWLAFGGFLVLAAFFFYFQKSISAEPAPEPDPVSTEEAQRQRLLWRQEVERVFAGLEWAEVPGGSFKMGSRVMLKKDEMHIHRVTISPFSMTRTEITQDLWEAVMGNNPACRRGARLPVENVSWLEIQEFLAKLNEVVGLDLRLPTEAEWEYAAKAGTKGLFSGGVFQTTPRKYAWYLENSEGRIREVGKRDPNAWGLYDMLGNVWEWCGDYYDPEYYKESPLSDPKGPESGNQRVIRGGAWNTPASVARSANRSSYAPEKADCAIGFRLVRVAKPATQP